MRTHEEENSEFVSLQLGVIEMRYAYIISHWKIANIYYLIRQHYLFQHNLYKQTVSILSLVISHICTKILTQVGLQVPKSLKLLRQSWNYHIDWSITTLTDTSFQY